MEGQSAARPDLILFMTDQQRADQVGFSSAGHFETPHLDALAESGVAFDNAYSAATFCVPARNALLTGLLPHRIPTQVNGLALREGFWTVAHALREAGYETALIGKMHFAPVHAEHGFETMRLCEHLNAQGIPPEEGGDHLRDDYHDWLVSEGVDDWRFDDGELIQTSPWGPFPHAADLHPTAWIERETRSFLARRTSDRPLFLVVSFPASPRTAQPAGALRIAVRAGDVATSAHHVRGERGPPGALRRRDDDVRRSTDAPGRPGAPGGPGGGPRARARSREADRRLHRVDPGPARSAKSVVFFTSDHGDYAGNRGMLRKIPWIPYDDLALVPLVVAGPDVVGGRRLPDLVQSCDLALTCLDYAGVDVPPGVDFGTRTLRPLLTDADGAHDAERAVFCGTSVGWSMVRRGRFKYVRKVWTTSALFDLVADPDESVNLLDDPAHQDVLAELRELLDDELNLGIPELPTHS